MKKLQIFSILIVLIGLGSCSKDFLDETPKDFLSPPNAFNTIEDFNTSINNLFYLTRREFFSRDERRPFDYVYGTDLVYDGERSTQRHSDMAAAYHPTADVISAHWLVLYKIVAESNTVLDRIEGSNLTAEEAQLIEAQAKFFRALSYRTLVYLYGGVPLVTSEVTTPQTDFTRASREDVLNVVVEDLLFSAEHLPVISEARDGELTKVAAWHLLSEVYLALEDYQKAVGAASFVIDHPNMALMQNRFGSRANENPGDVYWDLFRRDNQNRSSGNTEGILVMQFELDVLGGGSVSTGPGGSYQAERHFAPLIRDMRINGDTPFRWPVSDYTGGRGIGWGITTSYYGSEIWESDFDNDLRNANHNFVREFVSNNPNSSWYGQVISTENPPEGVQVPSRAFYPYPSKVTTPFNHPEGLYANPANGELKSTAGGTYTDQYLFRLAETYLLRAEAYMNLGDLALAAVDINVVRERAQATPVTPAEVDIDYILDERMRELGLEERRRLTLMRLGLLYDRVVRYNPYHADEMREFYNLWPIPESEIERNHGAELTQNPGY